MKVYHQTGHNGIWNFDSINDDHTGQGVIYSPKNIGYEKLKTLIRKHSFKKLFDPQFFIPSVVRGRQLESYKFFPSVLLNPYSESEFIRNYSKVCAERCVAFQNDYNFNGIIIPTRYYQGMPSNYIEKQNEMFVNPFIDEINTLDTEKEIIFQLCANLNMIKDDSFSKSLLNWMTKFEDIDTIYLVCETSLIDKQIKDIVFIEKYLKFINSIKESDLSVITGYNNTESNLLSLADPDIVTMGAFENSRAFRYTSFDSSTPPPNQPNPRIYVSKLYQWIDANYVEFFISNGFSHLFDNTKYLQIMLQEGKYRQPLIYKHAFLSLSKQINELNTHVNEKRYNYLLDSLTEASNYYIELEDAGIRLHAPNDGSHIGPWITAINAFARKQGWT